jgi:hypothetical protein
MKDDQIYINLMEAYKQNRLRLGEKANLYLEAAMKLAEKGNVSEDAQEAVRYM